MLTMFINMSKSNNQPPIVLTEKQILYLNLLAFDYADDQIYELLNVTNESGEAIKFFVKKVLSKRYNTDNWNEIIKLAFKNGLLKKYDHLRNITKNQANIYSEKIFTDFFLDKVSLYDPEEPIRQLIYNFINSCDITIENNFLLDDDH